MARTRGTGTRITAERATGERPTGADAPEEARARLAARIERWTATGAAPPPAVAGLALYRLEAPTEPVSILQEPSVCVIGQGAKRLLLGSDVFDYDAHHFLITSLGLPVLAQVIEASPRRPYLGLKLKLDLRLLAQLTVDSNLPLPRARPTGRGMAVGKVTPHLLDAFARLVDLLEQPRDLPVLAPLVQQEILYRLLVSDLGPQLRRLAAAGSHGHRIALALDRLRRHHTETLRVDELAALAGMSPSSFHHHFRAMTAMSPLQYQKWLRLHEARRLMLAEGLDAASAAFRVGYESASQFSREYRRLFGAPPARDVRQLQQLASREPSQEMPT